jgi:choline dehydrogenase
MGLVYGLLKSYSDESVAFPGLSIAVIERGISPVPYSESPSLTRRPSDWCRASHSNNNHSSLTLSHQMKTTGRIVKVPTGRGLGGTTNINACLCTPPCREDFSEWPEEWKGSTILESIHELQDVMLKNQCMQHHECALDVRTIEKTWLFVPDDQNPWREATFPSVVSGVPTSTTTTSATGECIRKNYYEALVRPLIDSQPQLSNCIAWFTGCEVQRLLFDDESPAKMKTDHVVGVETCETSSGQFATIFANREVILCAGAIETPALLLTSGIGHHEDLARCGIEPRIPSSRAGVGRNLFDHVLVPRVFFKSRASGPQSPSGVQAFAHVREGKNRYQVMMNDAGANSQVVPHFVGSLFHYLFTKSAKRWWNSMVPVLNIISAGTARIVQATLSLLFSFSTVSTFVGHFTQSMNLVLLRPKSRGAVEVRPRVAGRTPLRRRDMDLMVDVGYMNDADDVEEAWQGWQLLSEKVSAQLFPRCFDLLSLLPSSPKSAARCPFWFRMYCLGTCVPYFHYCGSCAIKRTGAEEWVVDPSLRVRDVGAGLRVCDASVFPCPMSGPTALTCAGIGFALAKRMLADDAFEKTN